MNYETSELILRFDLKSLEADSERLKQHLKDTKHEIVFRANLGIDYINTQSHPPMEFPVEGLLTVANMEVNVSGKGELHHLNDSGQIACMLGMVFQLDLKKISPDLSLNVIHNIFSATITQAILHHDNN